VTAIRLGLRLLVALSLTASSFGFLGTTAAAHVMTSHVAAGLPSSRLEFGLSSSDTAWMNSSGVPWGYRFAYLAGGVNTTNNWLTWQDPAKPPGQFALDYMTSSTTAPANYIPVFTWYQLLQSTPSTGSSELDRDYSNLNTASTMSSYYSSFKILMQKAAQYGGQVVVHVEPDFWGYMQQKAAGAGASSVSAMVKSSGFAEAAAFPDNLVGFSSELKFLRDTYAPNALLAMHASMWSSGIDLGGDTRSSIDPVAEADKTAAFLNSAGAGSWDAVFNDVDDHNAAWWELASCGTPPCVSQSFTHWWDANNVNFPNFTRYLAWVADLHAKTARPQVVWQVPMGNQYFLTMNNTCGHYQDNVAPYFIGHPTELFNAGLVAVLFGPGNGCQTMYDDSKGDGVTNNNGAPTTDQLGGCNACNTNVSSWADDDGGYLRIFVGRYYSGHSPCISVAENAQPGSPQSAGVQVVVSAAGANCPNPQYQFWTLAPGASSWTVVQPYSSMNTFSWSTAGKAAGTYQVAVWARDTNSTGIYGNTFGRWDAVSFIPFTLVAPTCTGLTLGAAPPAMTSVGSSPTFTATGPCPDANPVYQFFTLAPGAGSWTIAQAFSTSNTFSWSTTGKAPGGWQVAAWVRDASSGGVYSNSFGTFDLSTAVAYTLTTCSGLSLAAMPASPAGVGGSPTFTASATGCPHASALYQFFTLAPGAGSWTIAQAFSSTSTFSWSTTGKTPGVWQVAVWVRDASSGGVYSNSFGTFDISTAVAYTLTTCSGVSLGASPSSSAPVGTSVTFTANAIGCPNPNPVYQFWVLAPGASSWTIIQAYSTSNTFIWNTTGKAKGSYQVAVWVRDASSGGAASNAFGTWDGFSGTVYTLS